MVGNWVIAKDGAKNVVMVDGRQWKRGDADRQTSPAGSSPGFFKSGPGMVAIAVMAVGTGYALYSASHDRIHSPGKQ